MRVVFPTYRMVLLAAVLAAAASLPAQQPDPFRWMDFHSEQDQSVIAWVTRSLAAEKWTAIREIGVQYDAALVVTTRRAGPQSLPGEDTFTVWSMSLTNHGITPLITGANLRFAGWMKLGESTPEELAALYDSCAGCAADTYFTAFHYDLPQHGWAARWMRGGQAAPVWSANPPAGVAWTQVYAAMAEPNGREFLATWSHFDYGKQKPPEDFLYRYDLDAFSGLEHTQPLNGKDADAMMLRLCSGQGALPGLARGQDSVLCQELVKPRTERKPVTTPPANNRGKSVPPAARH
ncbi:MAG: hypothetical protein ABR898_17335 [Terracidiphilus sp.]